MNKILMVLLAASVFFTSVANAQRKEFKKGDARRSRPETIHRVLPAGQVPNDARLGPLRDLDSYFPFEPPESVEDWEKRRSQLRHHVQVSVGLWPMPNKTPLNSVIHGKMDRGDYTVEKVYFESFPGFFVTGNLYRPKLVDGQIPGVLCPHGHYQNGRFRDLDEASASALISSGEERFLDNARSPLQARCAHLARMGATVFHYDMIGYADCQQISEAVAHRFAQQRPNMNDPERWGLFSPQAESYLQSVMGLQTWNSIRALDFLEALPEVDPQRIGVTGSSGGGTQTFILCAIDPRPAVAFPAVMVSTAMQGGCTCENCCNLRIGTGNVEIAALFAPKPLGLSAANDWTNEMETKGLPELKQLYTLLGKPENVQLTATLQYGHGYNQISRRAMYEWFDKHLGLNGDADERPIEYLERNQLTVWNDEHPRSEGGEEFERQLLQHWTEDSQKQIHWPHDKESLQEFKGEIQQSVDALVGSGAPTKREIIGGKSKRSDDLFVHTSMNKYHPSGHFTPYVWLIPPAQLRQRFVIWLSAEGKSSLFTDGEPNDLVIPLIEHDIYVAGIDLLGQGEFKLDPEESSVNRFVPNPREAAPYTFGYNPTLFASRVRDVVNFFSLPELDEFWYGSNHVTIVALDSTSAIAAVAATKFLDDRIDAIVLNTNGFRFQQVDSFEDPYFFPGGAKHGDLPGYLVANAPRSLWLAGETDMASMDLVRTAYRAGGAKENLHIVTDKLDNRQLAERAVQWVIEQAQQPAHSK